MAIHSSLLSLFGLADWFVHTTDVLVTAFNQVFDHCQFYVVGICMVRPDTAGKSIFGFAEFVQALALLIVVYTVSDVRYRFRIAIAPLPLREITFGAICFIGLGTLLVDFWYSYQLPVPRMIAQDTIPQTILGSCFIFLILCWTWFAFLRPPTYGKRNARKYIDVLYYYISRGSTAELPVIASELSRSARAIISSIPRNRVDSAGFDSWSEVSSYAYEIIRMIAEPKFCRAIVLEESGTAIAFISEATKQKKFFLPLGPFALNLTHIALSIKDSVLYTEQSGYDAGLLGIMKRFSTTLYGDYQLIEAMAGDHTSPFDLRYSKSHEFDPDQIEALGEIIGVCVKSYLDGGYWAQHSYAIYRAFGKMTRMCLSLQTLDVAQSTVALGPEFQRFRSVVSFYSGILDVFDKYDLAFTTQLRRRGVGDLRQSDLYDHIAKQICEIIFTSTGIHTDPENSWWVQHNTVWSELFAHRNGVHDKIVQFKIRRILFDEIKELDDHPNYKSSRILGFCIYVMGFNIGKKDGYASNAYALRKVVIRWTQRNYMTLRRSHPDIAKTVLMGSITYDERNRRLVKTYGKGLSGVAKKDYLKLQLPRQKKSTRNTGKARKTS